MKVVLFGATGMIGQGVLREALLDDRVTRVIAVGRRPSGSKHAKVRDVVVVDVGNLEPVAKELAGFDAALFCAGQTAVGKTEAEYSKITYDLTLATAKQLLKFNPASTFIYVSGKGTDSTEKGGAMWARVKGRTENALLALPFKGVYMFRPGLIVPLHGIRSQTGWYNLFYAIARPISPLITKLSPGGATNTERLGRAILRVARDGHSWRLVESADINALGR